MMKNAIYRADGYPVFQNRMYDTYQSAVDCPKGDIFLVQDADTGLIYNAAFDPDLMVYDSNYQNEQGVSGSFIRHLHDVRGKIGQHFSGRKIVEVGCGKALFMDMLLEEGFDVVGVDPTYEGTSPLVIKEYFSAELNLKGEAIVLRHVLEHIRDPVSFLDNIREANGGGLIYIEVPCFDWIMANRCWFDIFYEHVNYFRLPDFHRMFGDVREAGHTFGGQYLYVIADLATLRRPARPVDDVVSLPEGFSASIDRFSATLRDIQGRPNGVSVVWGGASKGVIFSLLMQRQNVAPSYVVDINPAKQGKYLAASGLKVAVPDDVVPQLPDGTTVFVMNDNYLSEVKAMTDNRFNYVSTTP